MKLAAVIFCGACLVTAAMAATASHSSTEAVGRGPAGRPRHGPRGLAAGVDVNQPLIEPAPVRAAGRLRTPLMAALAEEHLEIVAPTFHALNRARQHKGMRDALAVPASDIPNLCRSINCRRG